MTKNHNEVLKATKRKLSKFDNIVFREEDHTYKINVVNYTFPISSTGWIKKFYAPFDPTGSIVKAVAERERVSITDIKKRWSERANNACIRGNYIHEYLEQKAYFVDAVYEGGNEELKTQADNYWNKYFKSGKYIVVKPELIMGSFDYEVAGACDLLAINERGKIVLIDYKTSKNIDNFSKYRKKMSPPFDDYQDCNFIHYSLQLSLYKVILKDVADIDIDAMEIVWFSKKNDNYKIISCIDFSDRIRKILKA